MPEISVSLNMINDSGYTIEVSEQVPLSEILPQLIKSLEQEGADADLHQYLLFVGKPVRNLSATLTELGISNGDAITIVRVRTQIVMSLVPMTDESKYLPVEGPRAYMGRADLDQGWCPEVDLTEILSSDKHRYVSRRQAIFTENEGIWSVQLHERANAPMFVDGERVSADPVTLSDGNVISFGASPNRAHIQLIVRFHNKQAKFNS